jgi:hypothetical protein
MSNYENQFFDYFTKVSRQFIARPLYLGGYSYSGGGEGGPPGGYLGMLPQTQVAYDYTEDNTNNGFVNPSGYTLLDNLNHIRYNIKDLQDDVSAIVTSGNMGVTIEHNGTVIAQHVLVVDTTGYLTATDNGSGHVTLDVTISGGAGTTVASGVFNETPGGALPTTNFTTNYDIRSGSLQVYWNGVRQLSSDITVTGPKAFTTAFTVTSPDTIRVDYETMVEGAGGGGGFTDHGMLTGLLDDDHPQYLTSGRGDTRYYGKSYLDAMFNLTVMETDFGAKGELLVGSGYHIMYHLPVGADGTSLVADSTQYGGMRWTTISGMGGATVLDDLTDVDVPAPINGQVLTYRSSTNRWVASGVSGSANNGVSLFLPDADPSGPDSQNDEFSNSSLAGTWTEWDYANRCTIVERDWGLEVLQGYYITGGFGGVYKTAPAGSTWTIETKVSLGHSYTASGMGGFMLLENPVVASGKAFFFGPVKAYSGVRIEASLWTDYDSLDTVFASYPWTMPGHDPSYLRVVKCGTNQYQFWISTDGFAWTCLYNGSLVTFNPTSIGLVAGNWSYIDVGSIFHFYRVRNNYTSTAYEPVRGRRVTI